MIMDVSLLSSKMSFSYHSPVCAAAQTELMTHCEDIPAVREVLQEDGLLLLQTLLEV